MCTCDCDVGLRVHRVIRPKVLQPSQNAISDRGVSGLGVEDEVDESVIGIARVPSDESPRVDPLA
jgi:hypothetical protein